MEFGRIFKVDTRGEYSLEEHFGCEPIDTAEQPIILVPNLSPQVVEQEHPEFESDLDVVFTVQQWGLPSYKDATALPCLRLYNGQLVANWSLQDQLPKAITKQLLRMEWNNREDEPCSVWSLSFGNGIRIYFARPNVADTFLLPIVAIGPQLPEVVNTLDNIITYQVLSGDQMGLIGSTINHLPDRVYCHLPDQHFRNAIQVLTSGSEYKAR